jgi:hypothetical protein
MNRTPKIIIFLLASALPMFAQGTAPAPTPADTSAIILAQKPSDAALPAPKPADAPHADSSAIDAAISAGVPAYDAGLSARRLGAAPQDTRDRQAKKPDTAPAARDDVEVCRPGRPPSGVPKR